VPLIPPPYWTCSFPNARAPACPRFFSTTSWRTPHNHPPRFCPVMLMEQPGLELHSVTFLSCDVLRFSSLALRGLHFQDPPIIPSALAQRLLRRHHFVFLPFFSHVPPPPRDEGPQRSPSFEADQLPDYLVTPQPIIISHLHFPPTAEGFLSHPRLALFPALPSERFSLPSSSTQKRDFFFFVPLTLARTFLYATFLSDEGFPVSSRPLQILVPDFFLSLASLQESLD